MRIGSKLKLLRNLKGYTQEEVAKKLNISRRAYTSIENDATKIDYSRLEEIAKLYNISLKDITDLNENQVFTNCFNNNNLGFFSANTVTTTHPTEVNTLLEQMEKVLKLMIEEHKVLYDIVQKISVQK